MKEAEKDDISSEESGSDQEIAEVNKTQTLNKYFFKYLRNNKHKIYIG